MSGFRLFAEMQRDCLERSLTFTTFSILLLNSDTRIDSGSKIKNAPEYTKRYYSFP